MEEFPREHTPMVLSHFEETVKFRRILFFITWTTFYNCGLTSRPVHLAHVYPILQVLHVLYNILIFNPSLWVTKDII